MILAPEENKQTIGGTVCQQRCSGQGRGGGRSTNPTEQNTHWGLGYRLSSHKHPWGAGFIMELGVRDYSIKSGSHSAVHPPSNKYFEWFLTSIAINDKNHHHGEGNPLFGNPASAHVQIWHPLNAAARFVPGGRYRRMPHTQTNAIFLILSPSTHMLVER